MKPLFIVISAPSGGGKTTLCDLLLQTFPELCYSISCTTREPRIGEIDGEDYHFFNVTRFKELVAEDKFLEHALVHDNYYGTLKEPVYDILREGQSVLLDIDVEGARQIREHIRELPQNDVLRQGFMDIFVKPPSLEELRARLIARGSDTPGVIEKRIGNAARELEQAAHYMYQVVNDELTFAYRRLCDIIVARGE